MLRAVLLALAPLVVLLLVTEGVLWTLGLGDPDERNALTHGFDESARYVVPDPDVPGGWMSQIFDAEEGSYPEVHVPPRGTRLRVFMFGGSNTQGFPTTYIEGRLNQLMPDPGFEVFNFGRQGYGSERVRILLTQALALHPDIVFIYMGHNEFVERGFAMELADQWKDPWLAHAADGLMHLRMLNVLVSALEPSGVPAAGADHRPESRRDRDTSTSHLQYEQTLLFFDVYRRNYEAMIKAARASGAQVLISTLISNDFDPPMQMNFPPDMPKEKVDECIAARARALGRIPPRFLPGLIQTRSDNPTIHLRPADWGESLTEEARAQRRARSVHPTPPTLRTLRPPLADGPFMTEPELWSDKVPVVLDTIAQVHARQLGDEERAQLERAVGLFEVARRLVPDHPLTLYEQGLALYLLGQDPDRAAQLLHDAARFDRSPTKANDIVNGTVRDLAAEHPDLAFVDAARFMRGLCPDGLIGYEVMMDNCHMYPRVLPVVMDEFIPRLAELGKRTLAERAAH